MKQIFFLLLLFLFFIQEINAQNLIPNASFEEYEKGCPADLHDLPTGWSHFRESPNSFHTCIEPENLLDSTGWAPLNGFGFQYPAEGDSYIGLATFGGAPFKGFDFREYIGTELIEPLEIGEEYHFSMKVSPAIGGFYYGPQWFSNNLGIQLTMNAFDWLDNPMPINNFAHVYETNVITDTTNWTTIDGSFVADQEYSHISIGNFFVNSLTDTIVNLDVPSLIAYYFVDDLCLSKNSICSASAIDEVTIFDLKFSPNPTTGITQTVIPFQVENVLIFDCTGEKVADVRWNWSNDVLSVHLSDKAPGLYIISVTTERGAFSEKIMVRSD